MIPFFVSDKIHTDDVACVFVNANSKGFQSSQITHLLLIPRSIKNGFPSIPLVCEEQPAAAKDLCGAGPATTAGQRGKKDDIYDTKTSLIPECLALLSAKKKNVTQTCYIYHTKTKIIIILLYK